MRILLLIPIIFFLNSCSQKVPCEPKKIYVKSKVPRLKILYKVEFYKIADYKSYDDIYWLINKKEFRMASDKVKKKEHKIKFYEKQNIKFNREFVNET